MAGGHEARPSMRASGARWLSGLVACAVGLAVCAGAESPRRPRRPARRAAPPKRWDPSVRDTFEADAFSRLGGEQRPLPPPRPPDDAAPAPPAPDGDFDRSDVMRRLERARSALEDLLSSKEALAKPAPRAAKATEEIVAMARRLAADDPDHSADVHYVRHADGMAQAARRLQGLLGTGRHAEALDAVRALRTSCDACHGQFNP